MLEIDDNNAGRQDRAQGTISAVTNEVTIRICPKVLAQKVVDAVLKKQLSTLHQLSRAIETNERQNDCLTFLRSFLKSVKIETVESENGEIQLVDSQENVFTLCSKNGTSNERELKLLQESLKVGLALYTLPDHSFFSSPR